jgi:hypothetical protein
MSGSTRALLFSKERPGWIGPDLQALDVQNLP